MDDTGTHHPLPDGSLALMLGRVAVISAGPERLAICRDCGRELGRWRWRVRAPRQRSASTPGIHCRSRRYRLG